MLHSKNSLLSVLTAGFLGSLSAEPAKQIVVPVEAMQAERAYVITDTDLRSISYDSLQSFKDSLFTVLKDRLPNADCERITDSLRNTSGKSKLTVKDLFNSTQSEQNLQAANPEALTEQLFQKIATEHALTFSVARIGTNPVGSSIPFYK
jgi:hypothetical protein